MKRLTKGYRLQADSIGEITDEFDALARRVARREGLTFCGRKLRPGPLLNALIYEFLSLPEDEAARRAREALARLESFLADDAEGRPPAGAKADGEFSGGEESGSGKSRRKGA